MKPITTIVLILAFLSNSLRAQLITSNLKTANQLVESILLGEGVVVSNIKYTGHNQSIGEFNGVNSNIGIDNGIILSTGSVLDHSSFGSKNGPAGPNNGTASKKMNTAGDNSLATIGGNTSRDAAILEFDFKPNGDKIEFKYVFASEEYPEFINSSFNDVFAFFISGPGIGGNKNMAIIPGTNKAVSIKNINHVNNSNLYNSNGNGNGGSQSTNSKVVNYDGFTNVFVASSSVIPCETYHLKIAISDIGDSHWDSSVFLEANSLNSLPKFKLELSNSFNPLGDSSIAIEGCSNVNLEITRFDNLDQNSILSVNYSGSAINGVDINQLPSQITFAPFETTKNITINPIDDNINEGTEKLIINLQSNQGCDPEVNQYVVNIMDKSPVETNTNSVIKYCEHKSVEIIPNYGGGIGDLTIQWYNNKTTETILENPTSQQFYTYEVTDQCNSKSKDSVQVVIPNYTALSIVKSNDTILRCPGKPVSLYALGQNGGLKNYSYEWSTGENTSNISKVFNSSENLSVTVTDNCGMKKTEEIVVQLNYPSFKVQLNNDTTICKNESIRIMANPTGGIEPYSYTWSNSSSKSASIAPIFASSELIKVSVMDSCGTVTVFDSIQVTTTGPTAKFDFEANQPIIGEEIGTINTSIDATSNTWILEEEFYSDNFETNFIFDKDTSYHVMLAVKDENNCVDTISKSIQIHLPLNYNLPNAFTPNNDGLNDIFVGKGVGVKNIDFKIFDRWGELIFVSNNQRTGWDGKYKGNPVQMDVYVYQVSITGYDLTQRKLTGHVSLIK